MPCSDGRDSRHYIESEFAVRIKKLESHNTQLTAALCALNNAIKKQAPSNYERIITYAQVNGAIEIREILAKHNAEDEERLKQDLEDRYSPDELELIKKIITK